MRDTSPVTLTISEIVKSLWIKSAKVHFFLIIDEKNDYNNIAL